MNLPLSPLRLALNALSSGETEAALPLLRQCLDRGEDAVLAGLNLGIALTNLGRLAEAVPHLQAARAALPHLAEPRFRLGQIAGQQQRIAAARDLFNEALMLQSDHVMSMAGLAMLEEGQGNAEDARQWVAQAMLLEPDEPGLLLMHARLFGDAASCRALLSQRLGGVEAAQLAAMQLDIEELREAAAAAPLEWRWQAALGLALLAAEELEPGFAALRLACILADDAPELEALLGLQLAGQNRHAEAEPLLAAGIAASHGNANLRASHALTLLRLNRLEEARLAFEAAIADFGPQPELICNLALTLSNQGLQDESLRISDEGGNTVASLGCRMGIQPYHPIEGSAAALHRTARRLGAALPHPVAAPHPPGFDPERRLRVGFFSGHLGHHPVGWLTLSAIEALPEAEIEVACYSLKPKNDVLAQRFHARAELWRELQPRLDNAALAAAIRADHPDIVVDMGGHGEGGRVTALAQRAAPVQIKWVGAQSATTGVPAMDWMLTDAWETPPGSEAHYTEALLRMPDGYACYTPPPWAPPVAALPALSRGHITFGCFNNLSKITPEVLTAWGRILASLPWARLVLRTHALSDPPTRARLITRAAAAGMPVERLELHGPASHEALLAAYNDIDIALDPFPYAGGLTACEALWMGVPLVAMAGSSFAGRHAVSHLNNIGLGHWVTEDVEGYVARAVAAAHDLPALAELRAGMRARMKSSPLMDAPRFATNFAAALRHAWRLRCAQTQSGAGSAK